MSTKYYSRHGVFMARTSVSRNVAEIQRQIAAREAASAEEDSE